MRMSSVGTAAASPYDRPSVLPMPKWRRGSTVVGFVAVWCVSAALCAFCKGKYTCVRSM